MDWVRPIRGQEKSADVEEIVQRTPHLATKTLKDVVALERG